MSTLRATNIKNPSSAGNNIVLSEGGGVVISGVTTASNVSVASSITASTFYGSGANLTGVAVNSATGNFTISSGNLIVGSGYGIDFSATANSSGTMTSELLSDYEEGTWTPVVGGTATYNYQQGNYTKIGRFVWVRAALSIGNLGTGSSTTISGLPFSAGGITGRFGGDVYYFTGLNVNVLNLTVYLNSSTTLRFSTINTAGTGITDDPAIFTSGTGAAVQFNAFYYV